jgi:ParB family chromosome partitioning protein
LAKRAIAESMSVRAVEDAVRAKVQTQSEDSQDSDTDGAANATPATRRLRPPGFRELEELLAELLDTKVAVDMGKNKGRVVIEFADLEDLERIYRRITEPTPA